MQLDDIVSVEPFEEDEIVSVEPFKYGETLEATRPEFIAKPESEAAIDLGPASFGEAIEIGVKRIPAGMKKSLSGLAMIVSRAINEPGAEKLALEDFRAADTEIQRISAPLKDSFWNQAIAGATETVVVQAPLLIAGAALAPFTGGVSLAPSLAYMGIMTGGSKTGEYLSEGEPAWKAASVGAVAGAMEVLTEKFGLRYFQKFGMPFASRLLKTVFLGEMPGELVNTAFDNTVDWAFRTSQKDVSISEFGERLWKDSLATAAQVLLATPAIATSVHPVIKLQQNNAVRMMRVAAERSGLNSQQSVELVDEVLKEAKGKTEAELATSINEGFNKKITHKIEQVAPRPSKPVRAPVASDDTINAALEIVRNEEALARTTEGGVEALREAYDRGARMRLEEATKSLEARHAESLRSDEGRVYERGFVEGQGPRESREDIQQKQIGGEERIQPEAVEQARAQEVATGIKRTEIVEQPSAKMEGFKTKREALLALSRAPNKGELKVEGEKGNWKLAPKVISKFEISPEQPSDIEAIEVTDADEAKAVSEANAKYIESQDFYQLAEVASSIVRDVSTSQGIVNSIQADLNQAYHETNILKIESISTQLGGVLRGVEENPRMFSKRFASIMDYNAWVDNLHRLADYAVRLSQATNDKLGQKGMLTMGVSELSRKVEDWKRKRTFHKKKEARYRVNGGTKVRIEDKRAEDISPITAAMFHSYLPTSKTFPDDARSIVFDIVRAELWKLDNTNKEQEFIDSIRRPLSKEQIADVTKLGFEVESFSRKMRDYLTEKKVPSRDVSSIVEANIDTYLDEVRKKQPKIVDTYRTIRREFFDKFKALYKDHLVGEARSHIPSNYLSVIDAIMSGGSPKAALSTAKVVGSKKLRAFGEYFSSYKDSLKEISGWGTDDYWTHMMIGNITVKEKTGVGKKGADQFKIIAVGTDVKDALKKAVAYIEEQSANGLTIGDITIDDDFSYDGETALMLSRKQYFTVKGRFQKMIAETISDLNSAAKRGKADKLLAKVAGIKPALVFAPQTVESKRILPGEKDIFVAMEAYSRTMWKKLSYDPVIRDMKAKLSDFEPNVRDHLESVLKWSKGSYGFGDKYLDSLFEAVGIEKTRTFSRGIARPVTSFVVYSKLMYRPIAAALNTIDGFSKTWIQFHEKYFGQAARALMTKEGRALVEKYGWSLGTRLEDEGGHLKSGYKVGKWTVKGWKGMFLPMGLFNLPELPIREHNFMTAYLYYKDQKLAETPSYDVGLLEEEAVDFAQRSVYLLQSSNTIAGRPGVMRPPEGRMLSVFMPYVVRQIEWIGSNANSPGFWARYIPYMLSVAGPRGAIAMLKSIPFLEWALAACGVVAFWDKIEAWMMQHIPGSGGVASFFGYDVVAPATVQLPTSGLAVVSTAKSVWDKMISPVVQNSPNKWYESKEGIKQVFPFYRNWGDVMDSVADEDGFVLDDRGLPKYNLNTTWDRFMVAQGIKPESKSVEETIHRINKDSEELERRKAKETVAFFRNELQKLFRKGWDESSEIPESVIQKVVNNMAEYKISSNSMRSVAEQMRMSRSMRDILNSKVLSRSEVLERQSEAGMLVE